MKMYRISFAKPGDVTVLTDVSAESAAHALVTAYPESTSWLEEYHRKFECIDLSRRDRGHLLVQPHCLATEFCLVPDQRGSV